MFAASGCSSSPQYAGPALMPIPESAMFNDPDNTIFMRAVSEYISSKKAPGNTRYEFTRLDLNNDGRREGIVLMKTPHQYWCNFNGCNMIVFKAHNQQFELVSEISPVRGPLTISNKRTNEWNDIIVTVSGRMNSDTKEVALQFDGKNYPPQPAFQPPVRYAYNSIGGVRIFP